MMGGRGRGGGKGGKGDVGIEEVVSERRKGGNRKLVLSATSLFTFSFLSLMVAVVHALLQCDCNSLHIGQGPTFHPAISWLVLPP
eukprot:scaffold53008_cov32-Tisochrysis_lutea.AAC.7